MNTELIFLLAMGGTVVAIVLLALLVNLFRQMTRFALAVGAVLALAILAAVVLSFVTWPTLPNPSVEIVHLDKSPQPKQPTAMPDPGPSAAVAVRRFLVGLIVVGVLGTVGTVVGRHLWQEHQKQTCLKNTLTQAQVYALLNGQTVQQGLPRRLSQGGGNVIVVGGQQEIPTQTYLPDGQGWEVLQ